jgi:LysM repeat protein
MKPKLLGLVALALALPACLTASPTLPANAPTTPAPATDTALPAPALTLSASTTAPALTAPPVEPPATATTPALTYTVQPGDTLFAIALANDVTVESLQMANGLDGDVIVPGQVLIIPGGTVVPPTPLMSPSPPSGLTVVSFTAGPNPAERGGEITLVWEVAFALKVTLWPMTYDRHTTRWHRMEDPVDGYPFVTPIKSSDATGQWTGSVPDDARYPIRFELEAFDKEGARVLADSDVLDLRCYPALAGGGYCPLAPQTIHAIYQPFEHGHMIWRSDTGQLLIIPTNPDYYLPWSLEKQAVRIRPIPSPPTGRYPPDFHFAGLWLSFDVTVSRVSAATPEQLTMVLSEVLGWPTAPQQSYDLTLQIDLDNTQSGLLNDHLYVTLPDGRIAALTLYDGAQGVTGPAWSFVEP